MTRSVIEMAQWSLAAQGAYALFGIPRTPEEALTEARKADFTSTQAERFLLGSNSETSTPQGLELLHHQPNDPTGFSASVFFDRSTNRNVLAIRGTEDLADIAEDFRRIGVQGYAGDQAVSLYRYYRKLTTAPGQPVHYSDSEVSMLNSMRVGTPITADVFSRVFSRSRLSTELAADVGISSLDGSASSVLPRGAPLIVTGHSLGGHLALLFGRFFPDVTQHVYTYNAPGIGPQGELALRLLGIPPVQPSLVTNVSAVMGNEAIANIPGWSKPGENVGVFTEPGSPLYQHSIVPLADSLALYGAFATLSPGLSGDPTAVSGILSAASPFPEDSLEVVLDQLSATLGVDGAPTLIARTLADLTARDDYYQNLYAVLDARSPARDYQIQSLAGKSAGELAAMGNADVSVRFALHELAPFAAKNADFSTFDDSFSGEWIASRAEWLAASLEGNLVERAFGFSGTADNVLFRDVGADLRYSKLDGVQGNLASQISALADRGRLQQFLGDVAYNRTVVFGSDADEQFLGLPGGDRLLGAAGGDTLDGAGGDDFLEGGAGADTLLGGAGDDTLSGGPGADRLEGGAGSDTYLFAADLDADTIVDHDGQIYAGTALLTGGNRRDGGAFVSSDGRFRYEFSGDLASAGTLVVNGALRIEGFRNGDLGIRVVEAVAPGAWMPVTDALLLGDLRHDFERFDEYGNALPDSPAIAVPGRVDLDGEFPGTPGNTHFIMGGGNDLVQDRLGGDDRIELGEGDDAGYGGAGNDLVEGGVGRDLVAGGRGDDVLHAGSVATFQADLDERALPTRSDGGDLLSGGDGDDTIFGDAESNLIEGGAGKDQIFGGAGDDWIGADVAELSRRERHDFIDFNFGAPRSIDFLWRGAPPPAFSLQAGTQFGSPGSATIGGTTLNPFFLDGVAGDADKIDAGPGNDTVMAGGGDDLIFGGDGNDYILAEWDAVGDYVDAGDGNDLVISGEGDDRLLGGRGDDGLYSSGGNDVLLGGEGRDFLSGNGGRAVLDGGPGDDMLVARSSPDGLSRIRIGRGSGVDVLEAWGGAQVVEVVGDVSPEEVSVAYAEHQIPARDGPAGAVETLRGIMISIGTGADGLFLADTLPADQQGARSIEFADRTVWDDAYLQSLLAADELPDTTQSMAGTGAGDLLYGTAGADTFTSSQGGDWLIGGAGNDVYEYAAGDGFDLIEDADSSPANSDVLRFASGISTGDVDVFASGEDFVLTAGAGGARIRGGRTHDGAIERVQFADTTSWSAADLEARAVVLPDNRAPEMPALLGRVEVDPGSRVEVAIPGSAISDPDRFDSVSYFAVTADGDRLPAWLAFDAASLTFSGTPVASDSGAHEILLIAADAHGAASIGRLTIAVGGEAAVPTLESSASAPGQAPAAAAPADTRTGTDSPLASYAPVPAGREEAVFQVPSLSRDPRGVGIPIDPLFREMQQRFDVLLQVGRANLGERYAEAMHEFEERRMQQEEPPPPPPPSEDEVAAWNTAMHAWHDRNPGFAETDLGGNDGTWTVGWGLPGPGESAYGGSAAAGAVPGLANSMATARISGAAAAPMLGEGMREIR